MRNIKKMIIVGFTLGMLTASTTVFANTREFIFHMDQSYLHGTNNYNTGYVASKNDNEQAAYITVSKFERSNNAIVSMWVSTSGACLNRINGSLVLAIYTAKKKIAVCCSTQKRRYTSIISRTVSFRNSCIKWKMDTVD